MIVYWQHSFIEEKEVNIGIHNRSFLYGDAAFESMRAKSGKIQRIDLHLNRLQKALQFLEINFPLQKSEIETIINELLAKNNIENGARVKLQVFRKNGGLYTPENKEGEIIITCTALAENEFTLNKKGLKLGLFEEVYKPNNTLAVLKTANALLYVKAAIQKEKSKADDLLILNEKREILECISSNIFVIMGKNIICPGSENGALPGVMRHQLIKLLDKATYKILVRPISISELEKADEVFLSNAIQGIQWVGAFKQRRYVHKLADELIQMLNTN
jgi:branched-subunit amino acid aminotransferase/4-amino-4-deoxychorismate lyase